ncbi:MAG TPA: hypothetical protein VJA82_13255 [Sediminibacterium sp.]|jgi:hypothetical protein|uniref:hypothetical protein n=1 Tax=Sediminibacterium sp. TaxID=1917865 RepID=UPI0008AB06D5|nr:hypothetical protein [Sediminibacterium sp.]OHC86315.1 MAG: hypothetical protein A2472_01720 [Sphingobacteriia bacterium RIFOXYC2_FULL_35_18]OHC89827.1 MAG: hypothetical protein A2546_10965 [Sphingobacteriia bacterium RIFOXYD2_FULL_35_12]OYY08318.1 MAG: hypothetical protein B7Y66_11205 [Sphingobacteriia bacterium 35-36-14]OYZ53172.1 MAG: hypothetical protein B7Y11_10595 [Sphingobacteriia bacterium 24-36-13]OZA65892.1 MAG: hypothetical protein B7X68_02670 [Sphingobacteriia bacterium 39-36-14
MQNEKRKWQMAFRRFVLENAPSEQYAAYFGLCRTDLRNWFEAQFSNGLSWENFGKAWQFEHIIPVTWFDTTSEEELKACWNYLNIRVSPTDGLGGSSDLLFAKKYFEEVYEKTAFRGCIYYIKKVESIINEQFVSPPSNLFDFIQTNQLALDAIPSFSHQEYQQYLETESAKSVLTEREILKKFG